MGGHIFLLRAFSSRSRSTILKSLAACHYTTNQRYSSQGSKGEHHHGHTDIEETAPSTAEEFKRAAEKKWKAEEKLKAVEKKWKAEEKLKAAEQGVANQTTDKAYDGTEEAILGDSNVESVKNRYKDHEPGADYRRRPHGD